VLILVISISNITYGNELQCLDGNPNLKQLNDTFKNIECADDIRPETKQASREYFSKLLDKGMSAPIEDFLKLWNTHETEYESDPYFFESETRPWGALNKFVKIKGTKYLIDNCRPDVLYSWAEDVKIANVSKHLKDGEKWQGSANPFLNPEYEGGQTGNTPIFSANCSDDFWVW
jgi:hypothetical protein